ncbi:uncharacterized protein LOC118187480 [Stegodyphus dumicola]|uniref:uncharacterized protein LOC118187480 n=1 Tax=Stegodyphus dumicola TaxID=202533 RepID=UPI0015AEF2CD|nr:uncharacterized protein LOC118187480 [Stegodyphus dumicola]
MLQYNIPTSSLPQRLQNFKKSATLGGSILLEEALLEPCFSTTSLHPASLRDFRWDKHSPSDQGLEIFTDGSKDDKRVGAAFAVFHNSQEIFQDHFRVSDHATVFQVESLALRKAALWASSSDFNKISIYTDSMSVLQSMNKTGTIPAHIQSLKELVSTLSNTKQVTLHWVRGHQGTRGNERADTLAKAATSRQDLDICLPISTRAAKHHIQEAFMSQWQERWEQGDTGRYTFAIFPNVRLSRVYSNHYTVQTLSNHGRFPQYLERFLYLHVKCSCGSPASSADAVHYITSCPLTKSLRSPANIALLHSKGLRSYLTDF